MFESVQSVRSPSWKCRLNYFLLLPRKQDLKVSLPCWYVASKISPTVFSKVDGDVLQRLYFFAFLGNGPWKLFVHLAGGKRRHSDVKSIFSPVFYQGETLFIKTETCLCVLKKWSIVETGWRLVSSMCGNLRCVQAFCLLSLRLKGK